MKITQIGKISSGQDGAIYGSRLFRFDSNANAQVFDLNVLDKATEEDLRPVASFKLDRHEDLAPHSNAVFFGTERFLPDDELPLLYSNIYNNYADKEDPLIGTLCVYRLVREGNSYKSTLVQLIRIDFCSDFELWRAYPDKDGVRPYGNFVMDTETSALYAFVMRTPELGTRYFKFDMPSAKDGEWDEKLGVRVLHLGKNDIRDSFDCPYHRFIQGAICYGGKIYSTEGFSNSDSERPAIRVINLTEKREEAYYDIMSMGFACEPELIDFFDGECYYSNAHGDLYTVNFD